MTGRMKGLLHLTALHCVFQFQSNLYRLHFDLYCCIVLLYSVRKEYLHLNMISEMEFVFCKVHCTATSPQSEHGKGRDCAYHVQRCRICLRCGLVGQKMYMSAHIPCGPWEGLTPASLNGIPGMAEYLKRLAHGKS